MSYRVEIVSSAEREYERLPASVQGRVQSRMLGLGKDPYPRGTKKLRASENYRVRVGAYRVLYTVDPRQRLVTVLAIGHRREVYRRLP